MWFKFHLTLGHTNHFTPLFSGSWHSTSTVCFSEALACMYWLQCLNKQYHNTSVHFSENLGRHIPTVCLYSWWNMYNQFTGQWNTSFTVWCTGNTRRSCRKFEAHIYQAPQSPGWEDGPWSHLLACVGIPGHNKEWLKSFVSLAKDYIYLAITHNPSCSIQGTNEPLQQGQWNCKLCEVLRRKWEGP